MQMLERENEFAALDALVADVRRGGGGCVIVEGPPGAGKSALLEALADRAKASRVAVFSAHATRLGLEVPFGLARRLLGEHVRTTPSALKHAAARHARAVFEGDLDDLGAAASVIEGLLALVSELVRLDGPSILAADDAQWADPPSLAFLAELADRSAEVGAGLAVAIDTAESSVDKAPVDRLRLVTGARVLAPAPLSVAAMQQIAAELLPEAHGSLAARVAELSGGNPLLATELLASAEASDTHELGLPEPIVRSVLSRVDGLGPQARALAEAVAVLGEAPLRLAAELVAIPQRAADAAADGLLARGILAADALVRFAQPVVGDALLATVPQFELAARRRRAAELLAEDGAGDEQVAAQLEGTRPNGDSWALAILRRAARSALGRGDPLTSARLLARAADEPPPPAERGGVLVELAGAQAAAGLPSAIEGFERALECVDDLAQRADAWHRLARLLHVRGDHADAAAAAARGQEELPPGDPRRGRLLAAELASARLVPGLVAEAAARAETLIAGNTPSEPAMLAELIMHRTWRGIGAERVAELAEIAVATDPLIDLDSRGFALMYVCGALNTIDQTPRASELLTAGLERAAELGDPLAEISLRCCRAWSRLYQGQLALARQDLDTVFAMEVPGWPAIDGLSGPPMVVLALELGDLAGAREALRLTPVGAHNPGLAWLEGSVAFAAGDAAAALDLFQAAGAELEEVLGAANPGILPWRSSAALAAAQLELIDTAQELASVEIDQARAAGGRRALGIALRAAGVVGAEPRLLEESVEVLEQSPARLELARSLMSLGIWHRRARQAVAARPSLGRAFDLARECGATALAERCLAEMQAAGARPRSRPRSGLGALTPGERNVAKLAAQGQTTRQIAAELFLSPKTVEGHLTSAFRKLRISSRTELGPLFEA